MSKYMIATGVLALAYVTTKYSAGVLTAGFEAFQGALSALALVAIVEWYLGGK